MIKEKLTDLNSALVQVGIACVKVLRGSLDLRAIDSIATMAVLEIDLSVAQVTDTGLASGGSSAAVIRLRFGQGGETATVHTTI